MPRGNFGDPFDTGYEDQEVNTIESLNNVIDGFSERDRKRARTPVDENALVIRPNTPTVYKGIHLSPVSLEFERGVTEDAMIEIGVLLGQMDNKITWWIGDLLLKYEASYGDGKRLAEIIGISDKTVRNYKSICKKVETSRRRDGLFIGHHEAVASMEPDEQDGWLGLAVDEKWSVMELREAIRKSKGKPEPSEYDLWSQDVKRIYNKALAFKGGERMKAIEQLRMMLKALEQER